MPIQYRYPDHPLPFGDSYWYEKSEVEAVVNDLQQKVTGLQLILRDNPIIRDRVIVHQTEKYARLEALAAEMKDVLEGLLHWNERGHIDESWWEAARELLAKNEFGDLKKLV